jgi:hypothetical protein
MKKGILNLQFWPGDRAQMLEVANLLADIEPRQRQDIDIMFSARWDAEHRMDVVNRVARKFDCYTCKTKTQADGWPRGCNYLWLESMQHIYRGIKSGELPGYKWVLTMENDDCPLTRDWLDRLHAAFMDLGNMQVVGNIVPYPKHHVNGNCLFGTHPEFMDFILKIKRLPNVGWDYYLADQFRWWGWADIPEIRSIWGTGSAQPDLIQRYIQQSCAMLHGVKDNSVIRWARASLTGPARTEGLDSSVINAIHVS